MSDNFYNTNISFTKSIKRKPFFLIIMTDRILSTLNREENIMTPSKPFFQPIAFYNGL